MICYKYICNHVRKHQTNLKIQFDVVTLLLDTLKFINQIYFSVILYIINLLGAAISRGIIRSRFPIHLMTAPI